MLLQEIFVICFEDQAYIISILCWWTKCYFTVQADCTQRQTALYSVKPSSELLPTPFLRPHNGMVTYCSELIQILATSIILKLDIEYYDNVGVAPRVLTSVIIFITSDLRFSWLGTVLQSSLYEMCVKSTHMLVYCSTSRQESTHHLSSLNLQHQNVYEIYMYDSSKRQLHGAIW